ncbi:glycohydrolase toxin TNT-related protein [Saccharopolyspora gloriosae]|uniref:TNT domain-containing protein n=1 Tax=Saccharopolyspora gloriosae TaxID=455344 RepID=A0A840NL50_9PSEU|nr:hypothetical protein [Saccharopolyspora gloriosae]
MVNDEPAGRADEDVASGTTGADVDSAPSRGIGGADGSWRGDGEHTGPVSVQVRGSGAPHAGWGPGDVDPASVTAPHPVRQAWSSAAQSGPAQAGGFAGAPGRSPRGAGGPVPRSAPAQSGRPPGQQGGAPQQVPQRGPGHAGPATPNQAGRQGRAAHPNRPDQPGRPGPQGQVARPDQRGPAPGPGGPRPGHQHFGQRPGGPAEQHADVRPRQGDRKETVAFMLHQFPIGYLPVAAASASRELPIPDAAVDPLAGRRFPPRDHPRADLVDDRDALARVRSGEVPVPEDEPVGAERPGDFTAGHDPLAELGELEWERRYTGPAGHRWPASESVPEGCAEQAEPIVLAPDTVLDALGSGTGRVAAPDGTAFTRRSLPPEYLELPYRRYRVLRPLPVWRAVSAAWFGGAGGGVRYRLTHSLAELVALGHLAELTAARLAAEAGTLRLDRDVIDAADRGEEPAAPDRGEPAAAERGAPPERPTRPMSDRAAPRGDRHEATEEIAQ